jgi:hypothetical protein
MLASENSKNIQTTASGHGPIWMHDYRVVLEQSTLSPQEIVLLMRSEFPAFAPQEIARFEREANQKASQAAPVEVGDEMIVHINGAGTCRILFTQVSEQSFTMRTLDGHFEAGRITFGAYLKNEKTVIRICSRARSAGSAHHVAYLLLGRTMQEKMWCSFLMEVAAHCGTEDAEVTTHTEEVKGNIADLGEIDTPTFVARNHP